jgi:hypothetical protein
MKARFGGLFYFTPNERLYPWSLSRKCDITAATHAVALSCQRINAIVG